MGSSSTTQISEMFADTVPTETDAPRVSHRNNSGSFGDPS